MLALAVRGHVCWRLRCDGMQSRAQHLSCRGTEGFQKVHHPLGRQASEAELCSGRLCRGDVVSPVWEIIWNLIYLMAIFRSYVVLNLLLVSLEFWYNFGIILVYCRVFLWECNWYAINTTCSLLLYKNTAYQYLLKRCVEKSCVTMKLFDNLFTTKIKRKS